MTTLKTIKLGNNNYYKAEDVKEIDSMFFTGTSRTVRRIVELKKIESSQYLYATLSKAHGWRLSSDQNKPSSNAALLLRVEWVHTNVPKMMTEKITEPQSIQYGEKKYLEAPPIFQLEDDEKFRDSDGNIFEIETRGERTSKGVYFLVKDVAIAFEMPNLNTTILNNVSSEYIENDDYKTFVCARIDSIQPMTYKPSLFLTYEGIIKTLYCSRSKKAKLFRSWATDVLFVAQMGSTEQREELGAKMIGQPARSVRAVFKTFANDVPCIYRFALGTVATLRKIMNIKESIPDNYIIIKYGLTGDLDRRTGEHIRTFEKIEGVKLGLMDFAYIDPKFLSQAECDIKEFFHTIETQIEFSTFTELVAINPAHEKTIRKQFKFIGTAYAGSLTDLILQIERLKMEIEMLKERHTHEIREKDYIITQKDMEIEKRDMQIQLIEMKHKNIMLSAEIETY